MHACYDSAKNCRNGFQIYMYDQIIFMNVVAGDESWIHYFEPH